MSEVGYSRLGYLAIVIGLVIMVVGILNGEVEIVLTKAIYICLECIGIG